jgi:hypothetical protein
MERFNYPSIKALLRESAELLKLLEYESWGYKLDRKEQDELDREELELARSRAANGGE